MAFEQGPYVQVAAFCEKVLTEQDGVVSLIRIVDRVTHTRVGPDAPENLPEFDYRVLAALTLKSGKIHGRHSLRFERQLPSSEIDTGFGLDATVHLEGENRGTSVVIELVAKYSMEGVYWYNVYFDDELLTRMPFEVRYARLTHPQQAAP